VSDHFDDACDVLASWETGRPQPAIAALDGGLTGSVLDVGLFHAFDPADHRRHADPVASVLEPGGRLYVRCLFERASHTTAVGPRHVRRADLLAGASDQKSGRSSGGS